MERLSDELAADMARVFDSGRLMLDAHSINHNKSVWSLAALATSQIAFLAGTAARHNDVLEMVVEEEGGIAHRLEITKKDEADERGFIGIHYGADGNFNGLSVDLEEYGRGKYHFYPSGRMTKTTSRGEKRIGQVRANALGHKLKYFHLPWRTRAEQAAIEAAWKNSLRD